LARLLQGGHEIVLVLSQPDRPAGRGLRPAPSPVKRLAQARAIDVYQPESIKSDESVARVRAARPDALVVAAYGLILPPALLQVAPHGAINIHASLLPRWRGAAPIQRTLLAGDAQTGVSIMQMDAGLDTGPLLAQQALPIAPDDDAATLHDKLACLGAEMIAAVLDDIAAGRAKAVPQPSAGATYAPKIDKSETRLDWTRSAVELERAVRAFHPALTALDGERLRIWRARVIEARGLPGRLLDAERLVVACGHQALALTEVQRAGGKRLSAAEFVRGRPPAAGATFQ
jgi:methionyl-tRNA formyltransferase